MAEKKSGNRYAVVDLEATGTGSDAKIIQVGIVLVEDGQIIQTYEQNINPNEDLSPQIQLLTGISNKELRKAPGFGQVAEDIYRLIEDAIFVAHNVKFDGNLLAENLFFEGFDLHTPRVDTVELAQVFFPTLEKYSLSHLAQALDLELEQAHTAISDARATAQLLIKIQEKIASLPKETIGQILQLADYLLHESRMVIDEVYEAMSAYSSHHHQDVHGLMLKTIEPEKKGTGLANDFSENLIRLGLDQRQDQEVFAQVVKERLQDQDKQVHFIQAQAGIGKTYGYLLPILADTSQPLLVSVPSLVLQQQIMEKEGHQLAQTFGLSIQSVKSSRHYLKLESFWQSLQREDSNSLLNRCKMQILVWLCETETGDMDELKQKYRFPSYFAELQHDGSLSAQSVFSEWDFWRRLHSKAQASQLLLTNHAYLLHHLKDQAYLTQNRILVIDEAQKLLLTAEEFTNQSMSLQPLLQNLQRRKDKAENLLEQRLYESSFFELQQLLHNYQNCGTTEIVSKDLKQLQQNLQELANLDTGLADLKWLLDFYEHFWLEVDYLDGETIYNLRATQMELLDLAALLPKEKTFCISATLDISKKVNLADLLGFKEASMDILSSQKSQQQEIFLLADGPDLVELDLPDQAVFVVDSLEQVRSLNQPILVLFTSRALLGAVSEVLEERSLPHLAQYRDGSEMVVKKRFERGECQILLATGSFWEGVDFSSQSQILQLIPRLPFDNPRDPLVKKINHYLREKGKQPFFDFNLPVMLLKLKQAIGRTKRTDQQVSAVVILDKRSHNKRYSRQIRQFLKEHYQLQKTDTAGLVQTLAEFFAKHSL
ncbi:Rad3-related DNA helicase [Streptococcus varani]|uniref:3'-5' exonuclease DinG n=1 Tax=Streptococcus varani TaxID=1608583 RepID=A0A0E4CSQ2_9STRE|nr:bifunctional DnaQ family exonuclease/ATP-dependent helicase [Streptococcus varani]CQR24889.1 Rad3-related DNA helicase [Streptococcus varani]